MIVGGGILDVVSFIEFESSGPRHRGTAAGLIYMDILMPSSLFQEIASRATWYCLRCHADVNSYNEIRRCACQKYGFRTRFRHLRERISAEIAETSRPSSRMMPPSPIGLNPPSLTKTSRKSSANPKAVFELPDDERSVPITVENNKIDITGKFLPLYWDFSHKVVSSCN